MTMRHVSVGLGLLALAAAGFGLSGVAALRDDEPTARPRPVTVETLTANHRSGYSRQRRYTGKVVAARASDLSFERAGKVVELLVDDGDPVVCEQVLARLDTRKLDAQRRRIEAERDQARARLRELQTGERDEVIRRAHADVAELDAQVRLLESRLERMQSLHERNAATDDDLDDATSSLAATRARRDAAIARRDEAESGYRQEQIDAQAALVHALEASLAELDAQLEDSVLTAPYDGTIARRAIDEGTVVEPGLLVYRIVESDHLEVRVGLPVDAAVRLAADAGFVIKAGGRARRARLDGLVPELNPTSRTRTAIFKLEEGDSGDLVPDQVAELTLEETISETGYWLPSTALVRGVRGLWSCYVAVTDGTDGRHRVESRDVEVLHVNEQRAYVRGTLSDGDRVIADGVHRIVPHQIVRVSDMSSRDSTEERGAELSVARTAPLSSHD